MAATEYTIRKKDFTLFAPKFHIYNSQGDLIGFCKQKAFKLKEDIRIFTDESMTKEQMMIAARSIIDFSAAYDVTDSNTQKRLGALQRKGMKSILRDEWIVLDENDNEIGSIKEDSMLLAMIRRFINLIPQRYHLADHSGHQLAEFRSHFNPFRSARCRILLNFHGFPRPRTGRGPSGRRSSTRFRWLSSPD